MMKIYLETPRMILREITPEDEENLLDLDSDPEVMKYLTLGTPSTREEIKAMLVRIQDLYTKHNNRFGLWAAIEKQSGNFMGWFLFRPDKEQPDNTDRIEIGYRLKKEFWGKGFATEGSKVFLAKGFEEYKIPEIFAMAMKRNKASWNVMEKLGMIYVREYPYDKFPEEIIVEYSIQLSSE